MHCEQNLKHKFYLPNVLERCNNCSITIATWFSKQNKVVWKGDCLVKNGPQLPPAQQMLVVATNHNNYLKGFVWIDYFVNLVLPPWLSDLIFKLYFGSIFAVSISDGADDYLLSFDTFWDNFRNKPKRLKSRERRPEADRLDGR